MEQFFSLEEIIELTKKMVEAPSYEGIENQETAVAEILLDFFNAEGIPAELKHVEDGRYNIIATLQGTGCVEKGEGHDEAEKGGTKKGEGQGGSGEEGVGTGGSKSDGKDEAVTGLGKNLLLCGHTDTVPPYDMADPFTFKIKDGKMYGRGVNDMKGQNACMAVAMAAIKRSGIELGGHVVFAGVIDEEAKSLGARAFIKDELGADGVGGGLASGEADGIGAADEADHLTGNDTGEVGGAGDLTTGSGLAGGEAGDLTTGGGLAGGEAGEASETSSGLAATETDRIGEAGGGLAGDGADVAGIADRRTDNDANPLTIHGAIVGEGTELNICPSQKGLEWLQFNFHGKTVHGGRQNIGINAIEKASKFIEKVEKELRPKIEARTHPNFSVASSMNYGLIKGGTQPSTVAGDCILQIDRRWIPGENYDDILTEYQEVLNELKADDPEFSADFQVMEISSMEPGYIHEVMNTGKDEDVVRVAERAVKEVIGRPPLLETIPAWTDGGLLYTYGKIPTIVLGPGSIETAHSADEHLAVNQLIPAVLIYSRIIAEFCR